MQILNPKCMNFMSLDAESVTIIIIFAKDNMQ